MKGGEYMCVYKIDEIKEIVTPIAEKYGFSKIYLFGSYARHSATDESDVDLYVENNNVLGIKFFGFCSELEEALKKPVDVITKEALYAPYSIKTNHKLISNIEKDRISLYEC